MGKNKTNPNKIPKTQADVDRARHQGNLEGLKAAELLMLHTLLDKHSHQIDILEVWNNFHETEKAFGAGRISLADVNTVLKEEHNINIWETNGRLKIKWDN